MKRQFFYAATLLLGAALSFNVFAQATLTVSANVTQTCVLTSGTLLFTGYTGTVDVTAIGSVGATCTNGSAAKIMMGQGMWPVSGSSDDVPLRRMQIGTTTGKYLSYFLYSQGANNTVWGNSQNTAKIVNAIGTPQIVDVYGTIPAGQNPFFGAYADTVTVTFTV
jgi:spore coat protein U-like protein